MGQLSANKMSEEKTKHDQQQPDMLKQFVTVMFTGIKGIVTITGRENDWVTRKLKKIQHDFIQAAIEKNKGVFVQSIGDGNLAYFKNALSALRAAVQIQKEIDNLNMSKTFNFTVLVRVGIHTGHCVVDENDLYGDVVNTASHFEYAADWGGILLSEDTYRNLSDKSEIYCRFVKQIRLTGNAENFNAYKAFWNPLEVELDLREQLAETQTEQQPESGGWMTRRIMLGGAISVFTAALIMVVNFFWNSVSAEQRRTITDSPSQATPSLANTPTR